MKYSIGDIAKLIGTSKQAIRHFERKGCVGEPEKNASGYREYTIDEAGMFRWLRLYRSYGFSLQDAAEMASEPCVQKLTERMRGQAGNMREEAEKLLRRAADLEGLASEMEGVEGRCGEIVLLRCPGLYRVALDDGEKIRLKEYGKAVERWFEWMPFAKSTFLWRLEDIRQGRFSLGTGMGIFETDLPEGVDRPEVYTEYYPPRPYASMVISSPGLCCATLAPLFRFLEGMGWEPAGDAFTRPVYFYVKEDVPVYFNRLYLPCREIEKSGGFPLDR